MTEQPDFVKVGRSFAMHYYQCQQTNRAGLESLYSDTSLMTFEGVELQGARAIMEKYSKLTYRSVNYVITTCDCQPILGLDSGNAVLVSIMGQLKTDDDPSKAFTQTFLLRQAENSFYIANETFRLVIHDG